MGSFTSLNSVDVEGCPLVYLEEGVGQIHWTGEKVRCIPSVAKAPSLEVVFMARLKPCPFQNGDLSRRFSGGDGGGVVNRPGFGGGAIEEAGAGIYGEGLARDGKHCGVVDGVAEDGVGGGDADAAQGFDFVFVGGDVDEAVGDDVVVDLDAGAEDVVGGDVEAANTFFDDPVVGGADGPDVAAVALEVGDEEGELGEDVGLDVVGEEVGGGGAEGCDWEAAVDLGHVAADVVLGDLAALVAFVALVEPGDLFGGDEFGVDGPVHEGGAGVAGPEGAVAVEYGDAGVEGVDAGVEVGRGEAEGGAAFGQGLPLGARADCYFMRRGGSRCCR